MLLCPRLDRRPWLFGCDMHPHHTGFYCSCDEEPLKKPSIEYSGSYVSKMGKWSSLTLVDFTIQD